VDIAFAVGPRAAAIYPEYLTDPAICICPSDAEETVASMYDGNGVCVLAPKDAANPQFGPKKPNALMYSYVYLGWMFDRCGDTDPSEVASGIALLAGLTSMITGTTVNLDVQVPSQLGWGLGQLATDFVQKSSQTPPQGGAAAEEDINVGIPNGNGGNASIYHLREGIERFMITDINNPAASAKAQSNIWVMFDLIGSGVTGKFFNHIPGGCNVLFLDGHVEFLKYPGNAPVSKTVANLMATVVPNP
jgi:prepilin-type processing-associated H-X9-DG protein